MTKKCHDCNVKIGQPHKEGCDVARCPSCGHQRLSCDCKVKGESVYTGKELDPPSKEKSSKEKCHERVHECEMNNKAYQRYKRECRKDNGFINEPSDIDNDGKLITLSNVNGVLAQYTIKGNRLFRTSKELERLKLTLPDWSE